MRPTERLSPKNTKANFSVVNQNDLSFLGDSISKIPFSAATSVGQPR